MRFLNPGMFALALLCFLLPFTNIKCNQQRIASVKGIDLIRNAPVQEVVEVQGMMSGMFSKITSQMPKDGDGGDERLTEYPLLGAFLVLLVAGIGTLILAIKKKNNKILGIWGIAAFALVLLLLLLEMVAMEFAMAKINQEIASRQEESPFRMEFDWGLEMGYLFLLLIAPGMIIYNIILLRKKPAAIAPATEPPLPPAFTKGGGELGNG